MNIWTKVPPPGEDQDSYEVDDSIVGPTASNRENSAALSEDYEDPLS